MKEITKKIHVPAHDVDTRFYIAFDGSEFIDQDTCRRYEHHKQEEAKLQSSLLFKSKRDIYIWPEEDIAHMYYIASKYDHDLLVSTLKLEEAIQDDYTNFGPGFYLLVNEPSDDYRQEYRLHNVDYYLHLLNTELEAWESELESLKNSIRSECLE